MSITIHSYKNFSSWWELSRPTFLVDTFNWYFQFIFPLPIFNWICYLYGFTTFLLVNVSMVCFFHPFTFSISVSLYFKCTAVSSTSDALTYILSAHLLLGLCCCDQFCTHVMLPRTATHWLPALRYTHCESVKEAMCQGGTFDQQGTGSDK